MDSASYAIITIFLTLLRIGITVYCVKTAGELNRSKLGWGFFGFFIPLLALIWIQFINPKVEYNGELKVSDQENVKINVTDINYTPDETFVRQKESLYKLKTENILTEEEYQEKLLRLTETENEKRKEFEHQNIEKLLKDQIEPLIKNLDELLNAGLLTQEDYEFKKSQLVVSKRKQIIESIGSMKHQQNLDEFSLGSIIVALLIVMGLVIAFISLLIAAFGQT